MQPFTLKTFIRSRLAARQAWRDLRALFTSFVVGLFLAPQLATAGILSKGLCRPYRQLVDNELFLMIAVIVGAVLVISWKLAPSGTYLQKGVGMLAALAIGLNLENFLQAAFGGGVAC